MNYGYILASVGVLTAVALSYGKGHSNGVDKTTAKYEALIRVERETMIASQQARQSALQDALNQQAKASAINAQRERERIEALNRALLNRQTEIERLRKQQTIRNKEIGEFYETENEWATRPVPERIANWMRNLQAHTMPGG